MVWGAEDLYGALGLEDGASVEEVQRAYKRLARVHHPDRNRDDPGGAAEAFARISEAHDVLSVAERRDLYAEARERWLDSQLSYEERLERKRKQRILRRTSSKNLVSRSRKSFRRNYTRKKCRR